MAKTKEELNAIKEEVETLNKKLSELTGEELTQVVGGSTGETTNCPYGKTRADKECNFVYHENRCQYSKLWELCPYEDHNEYECKKGYGRFEGEIFRVG